jgi:hypothetical protein
MRTEQDLRAALALLDEHAPTECAGLLNEPRTKSRRHRVLPLAGVVAAVAAVAIAVPLLVSGRETPTTPPAAAYEPPVTLRYSFTVDDVPGYTITPSAIERDVQRADITIGSDSTTGAAGAIYVYARGAFDPTAAKGGRPVEVNGHAGYFATLTSPTLRSNDTKPAILDAVVWQYAPDAWAMVQVDFRSLLDGASIDTQFAELKIARAVHTGHPHAFQVPFRFGYLPPGLVAEGGAPEQDGAWIYLGDGRPGDPQRGDFGSALSVWVYPATDPNGIFCQGAKTFKVDGRGGCFVPVNRQDGSGGTSVVYLNVDGGLIEMLVDNKHLGFYTDDQLKRIATTLHLAAIGSPSTWFDATTAMPR